MSSQYQYYEEILRSSPKGGTRAIKAAQRRQQRTAQAHRRELEREIKEQAKLSALEQAQLEVEAYENRLEVLLSIHKEQVDPWDWRGIAVSLRPAPPYRQSHNEFRARQRFAVNASRENAAVVIQQAQQQDDRTYKDALKSHAVEDAEWERLCSLARRILAGECEAYLEAIEELSPLSELASIGSSLHFVVHSARLLECTLSTNGRQAIPSEVKSLTAAGKLSVKPMPKTRFTEIYQDYVCACILRVARELFALLPLDDLLVSASVETIDTATGQMAERPFVSVVIHSADMKRLKFDKLDPSDTIMSFTHRGDLKRSRKTGDFECITPLTVLDLGNAQSDTRNCRALMNTARRLSEELTSQRAALNLQSNEFFQTTGERL